MWLLRPHCNNKASGNGCKSEKNDIETSDFALFLTFINRNKA